jgi:ligand-binding sensor domain-containing protein
MNKKLIFTFHLLILSFSCVEHQAPGQKVNAAKLHIASSSDTLNFTSGVRAIFQDRQGNYWFGSHSEGVSFYDGRSFVYYTTVDGLADNQIRSIQEDAQGNIWFGTANGVNSFDRNGLINHAVDGNADSQWTKTKDDIWFSAGNKQGVFQYDGLNLNYLAFPNPKDANAGNTYAVTAVSKGKNNRIWLGTYAGVFGYNGLDFNLLDDETFGLDPNMLHVRSILEDSNGRLWIGNNGIGVLLVEDGNAINFSEANELIHPASKKSGDPSPPGTLEHVFAIEEDEAGNIWFGDRDTGPWMYDGKEVTNYPIANDRSSPMIWTIYKDRANRLLFGLADGSIYHFNGKTFAKQF